MSDGLVLSTFSGIDLLGMGFKLEGFEIVWAPELIWGWRIEDFHPPAGVFDGVIGGPPCKGESSLAALNGNKGHTLAPEFWRIVDEAKPRWYVMEAVKRHDAPHVLKLSPRWLGERQSRRRFFHSNLNLERHVEVALFEHPEFKHAVTGGHSGALWRSKKGGEIKHYSLAEAIELQGLPADFTVPFWRKDGLYEAVANAVPLPMARAVARAVRLATDRSDTIGA